MRIRPHRRDDADRIAEILANGWRQAYSSFMPAEILSPRIDASQRRVEIAHWLDNDFDSAREAVFVAEDKSGSSHRVGGFIHMELGDKGGLGATGIVNLLYVDPTLQGRGMGRALLGAGAAWLLAVAPGPLVLSAYAQNRFRHAYAAMGAQLAAERLTRFGAHEIASVLYLWPDPAVLLQAPR